MKIRVEVSSLATSYQSGVASYTRMLTEALAGTESVEVYGHYFNFLSRQPRPKLSAEVKVEEDKSMPLRVYAKAQSYGPAHPFDVLLPKVDLTIFPNFASWPTVNSKLRATTVHDLTYLYFPEFVEAKNLSHLRRVVPRTLKKADFVLTVSEAVKNELVKEFDLNPDKCVVTPVPPEDIFRNKCDKQTLELVRKKYSLGAKKYILFLGNFEPRKNLKTLVEAYCLLPEKTRNEYQLVLAGGKGWKSEETQKAVDQAIAAGADIKHIGYIDSEDRPALYQAASLFAFPSLYEGFGIPVLEAMLSGCPVVAADIPVLRESGGEAALYADPNSPQSFADAMATALSNYPYGAEDMLKNVERFSWNKNVDVVLNKTKALLRK